MLPAERLRDKLIASGGKGVPVYRDLIGAYRFERFELYVDVVHTDPAAPWAAVRVRVDQAEAQVPAVLWDTPDRRVAVEDFLARAVREAIGRHARTRWSGRVTPLAVDAGGAYILPRTTVAVHEDFVEARLTVGLPAEGRKVLARPAQALFFDDVPAVVAGGLMWAALDDAAGRRHVAAYDDYLALRAALAERGLVAFVADGALLPHDAAGDRPGRPLRPVPMRAPEALAVTVTLPHRGPVRGLGIPRGVTLIAGGLYSGKSTLLAAIGAGVYGHVPGDNRELVATVPDAVTIRADPGRRIERVDVSAFVHRLPHGADVRALSVDRATGTLSMAAAVAEAMEIGASLLLVDEDDSAIAFVARDPMMQALVPGSRDALTPLVERVRDLWQVHGISTIIASGGLGEYLDVADTVIVMEEFQPVAATDRARDVVRRAGWVAPSGLASPREPLTVPQPRVPQPRGIGGLKGRGLRAEVRGREAVTIGRDTIELGTLPQLVDPAQARGAAEAILHAVERDLVDGQASMAEVVDRVFAAIEVSGLRVLLAEGGPADVALPRRHEVAAVLNRMRSLQVRQRRPVPVETGPPADAPSLDAAGAEGGRPGGANEPPRSSG